ncbi:tetratricopeptide repeat protein [Salinimicrobium sp. MT39]|uniref:Tetratricopeptide repeat protein n=1 Tax=Salinimicrobium profundisediminis TaxID=2994553 RepID=A0A9X3CWY0_9FLAO|nr:tetratricopeptide repeat protein [Salinimicrobium profundisediminis]MCX2836934.1 tetratricopeptide repeat protein [Salinimicrobium profundisediminis]
MKKLIFLLALCFSLSATAQNSQVFEAANKAYAAGNYEEAITQYEQILENGQTSAALHYNLANSYYKLNRVAPSIFHYEKALQLAPGDEDVHNNLGFARNMAIDAIGEEEQAGFRGIFDTSTAAFSASGWGLVAIFCMLVFVVFFLVYYFSNKTLVKRLLFIGAMFFLVMAISSAVVAATKQSFDKESNYAIVFSEEVQIKNEPSPRAEDAFLLHEGAKVKITENFQDWVEIALPNGSRGWLEEDNLKRL